MDNRREWRVHLIRLWTRSALQNASRTGLVTLTNSTQWHISRSQRLGDALTYCFQKCLDQIKVYAVPRSPSLGFFYSSHLVLAVTCFLRDSINDISPELILFTSVGTQVPWQVSLESSAYKACPKMSAIAYCRGGPLRPPTGGPQNSLRTRLRA